MEYPKINTLWKRRGFEEGKSGKNNKDLLEGHYSLDEFDSIKRWRVHEKIDGTNIRIFFEKGDGGAFCKVSFGGRTKDAQLPCDLFDYLQDHFTCDRLSTAFKQDGSFILFGEGHGPKIQAAGANYSGSVGFKLFDVRVGSWWLKSEDVKLIACALEIAAVPDLGVMTEEQVVYFVKSKPLSVCSHVPQMMEGVVCRTDHGLLLRNGQPLMWKLKCRDFL